jgi:hypothetical protein
MGPKFIRMVSVKNGVAFKETLINVASIWKIEVGYFMHNAETGTYYPTTVNQGFADPNAKRGYRIFTGGEEHLLRTEPNCPVMQLIEKIYAESIKGNLFPRFASK